MLIGVQFDIAWEDTEANFAKVRRLLAAGDRAPQSLIVLPELFTSGFTLNSQKVAQDWDTGPARQFLCELARERDSVVVGTWAVRVAAGRFENQAAAIGPTGRTLCRYSKMHPFKPGREDTAYAAGDRIVTFAWAGFTVAPFVCYDLRFPEIFRIAARDGANLFVVGANWPQKREDHWVALLRARAIENQAYVIGVNRCGCDPQHAYPGRSLVIDFGGRILADAGGREGLVQACVDQDALHQYRSDLPFLQDMRQDCLPAC